MCQEKIVAWIWNCNLALKKVCDIFSFFKCVLPCEAPFFLVSSLMNKSRKSLMFAAEHEDQAEPEPLVLLDDEPQLENGPRAMIDADDAHALDQIPAVEGDDSKMDVGIERDEMGTTKLAFDHEFCHRDTNLIRQPVASKQTPCSRIYKPVYSIQQHQTTRSPMRTSQV